MFFSFFIAKKYQVFKSKNNFVNLASKVSMFGIAIGTAALIIVLSVFNGFENLIIGMYNTFDPHLKIRKVHHSIHLFQVGILENSGLEFLVFE